MKVKKDKIGAGPNPKGGFIPKIKGWHMSFELKGLLLVLRIVSGFLFGYLLGWGLWHILLLF